MDWSKVVLSGHSQGGGHAGVMAKLFEASRACYFASPPDWDGGPADWMGKPNLTPASAQFGFTHLADPLVPYSQLSLIWQDVGLGAPGSAVSVDGNSAPFSNSHILTTNASSPGGNSDLAIHSTTVADAFTPINPDGSPQFRPVWDYLCFQ